MEFEDLCLPCAIIFFVAGFSLFILIAIPEFYFALHLGFYHFVASLVMGVLSGVFALIYYFLSWVPSEYEMLTFPSRETVRTKPIQTNPTPHKHRCITHSNEPIDPPSRGQLNKLKEALGLDIGSLQYKERGQGVYHVLYDEGKHKWRFIGSWLDLKEKL